MANDFESILKETLLNEGGYSFDPSDNGGETLFGISRVKNPGWAGWKEVDTIVRNKGWDKHNKANWSLIADACKGITSVFDFYRINFWNTIKGSEIGSYAVAKTIFDFGVNAGVPTSVKCVQRVLGIVVDGDFGPKSLAALNNYILTQPAFNFHRDFLLRKAQRYLKIVIKSDDDSKYLFGWISRAFEQFEKLFNLKQLLEPELLDLYNFILAGRNDRAIRLQIVKLKILVQNCLTKHGL